MARTANTPGLTRDAVLEAAARVLERDGLAGLTMRGVAAELGVQAPALYWHVDSKAALRIALYDHLMAGMAFEPQGGDWREDVRRMAHELRLWLLSRRDLARLIPDGFFFAPRAMTQMDTALGVLMGAGLAPRDAFYAFATTFSFVVRWCLGEVDLRARPEGERPGLDPAARGLLLDGEAYPHVAKAVGAFVVAGSLEEQFAFGVDSLIAGFERLTAKDGGC